MACTKKGDRLGRLKSNKVKKITGIIGKPWAEVIFFIFK